MDDRLLGAALIIIGLSIAGFGGTMGDIISALFYIIGFLIAFAGLGLFVKYWKSTKIKE